MRVLNVDDHPVYQAGLAVALGAELPNAERVGVGTLDAAVEHLQGERPFDAMLLDICLPDGDALSRFSELQLTSPATPVIVLSALSSPDVHSAVADAGAAGYLPKTASARTIAQALRSVASGKPFFARFGVASRESRGDADCPLTPRQLDVLREVSLGFTNKRIASHLGEYPHLRIWFDARSGVNDLHDTLPLTPPAADEDATLPGAIHGVGCEVAHDLFHPLRVRAHNAVGGDEVDADALARGQWRLRTGDTRDNWTDLEILQLDRWRGRFKLREVERILGAFGGGANGVAQLLVHGMGAILGQKWRR